MNKPTTLERAGIRLIRALDRPGLDQIKRAIQLLRQAVKKYEARAE